MAESEEELKSLLMRIKEESERVGLRQNKQTNKQTKIMASGPITAWQIERRNVEVVTDFHTVHGDGHLMRRTDSLEKILVLGKIEGTRRG